MRTPIHCVPLALHTTSALLDRQRCESNLLPWLHQTPQQLALGFGSLGSSRLARRARNMIENCRWDALGSWKQPKPCLPQDQDCSVF